ncbi:MAG: DUF120 domain-containing protein [Candidatus Micrarchaeota archaeon]
MLVRLASMGAVGPGVRASTSSIASGMGVSQQTVSRWLAELAAEGFVERGFGFVRLTPRAAEALSSLSSSLSQSLKPAGRLYLKGRLSRGLGEGGYYLKQPGYAKQFSDLLGYRPFPGTLNIVLSDAASVESKRRLLSMPGLRVAGFDREGRNFGGARLFPCELHSRGRKIACAVVIPDRTHHGENIVELVAGENLRGRYRLKEGELLGVTIAAA